MKIRKKDKEMTKEFSEEAERKYRKISKIVVIAIIVIGILISCDILLVTKANVGPFLAIRTKIYDDGGTKEYYGLGYKVIKYHQKVGRRDTVLGGWNLKYSVEPTTISSMDLALEFRNYPKKTYEKLYGEFLRISGKVYKLDNKKKIITIRYTEPEGAIYTLDIECHMAESNIDVSTHNIDDEITIIGTLSNYTAKHDQHPTKITISNCFSN